MIRIDRDRLDEQGRAIRPWKGWFKRSEDATEIALKEKGEHEAKRSIYASVSVRRALEKLFCFKCAYCESSIANQDWDVEHFRPKGRVAERENHPGYYWLAYEWTNLFPSCKFCNQNRTDKPTWDDPRPGETAGKLDQFPVRHEKRRAMGPDAEPGREDPLLFDPCADEPERDLLFNVKGEILPGADEAKAKASIRVYHLERRRLKDSRRQRLEELITLLLRVRDKGLPAPVADELSEAVFSEYCAAEKPYAAVARRVRLDPAAFGL